MCRFFGFLATAPTRVAWSLLRAPNALSQQSERDQHGNCHPHGWGIGFYDGPLPTIVKAPQPAFQDPAFASAARNLQARAVIAHIRDASVGVPSPENTHPFSHGRWLFAHNGTLIPFDVVGPSLVNETEPALLARRQGNTDSELIFYWLLTRMVRAGIDIDASGVDLAALAEVVTGSVAELARRCEREQADETAKLNFLLTDGRILLATRWHHSLFYQERRQVHAAEPVSEPLAGRPYHAFIIASEPIGDESWQEVPDGRIVAVERSIQGLLVSRHTHRVVVSRLQ